MAKLNFSELFIKKAVQIHNGKYDYSKSNYTKAKNKVIIECPDHGEFKQSPNNHTHKTTPQGCPTCANLLRIDLRRHTLPIFTSKAKLIHGETYDYSKVEYVDTDTLVTITCGTHGNFKQSPSNHLLGKGCPQCAWDYLAIARKDSLAEVIFKMKTVHGGRYDYPTQPYINAQTKMIMICIQHGEFNLTANAHLRGSGCPRCAKGTAGDNNVVYLWEAVGQHFNKEQVYKIGVTSDRLGVTRIQVGAAASGFKYKVIRKITLTHTPAREIERTLLRLGSNPKYLGFSGCTEFRALSPDELTEVLLILDGSELEKVA